MVFDFDNSLLCRDIGEATFAAMVEDETIAVTDYLKNLSPTFVVNSRHVSIDGAKNLTEYYEDRGCVNRCVNEIRRPSSSFACLTSSLPV